MADEHVIPATASEASQKPVVTLRGSPLFPEVAGGLPPSTVDAMDAALASLQARRAEWTRVRIAERIAILDRMIRDVAALAEMWVDSCIETKGFAPGEAAGEEWLGGPQAVLRNMRLLRRSLADMQAYGKPRIPGSVATRGDGQVVARVFPQDIYDRVLFQGVTIDVWMQPGVTEAGLPATQAVAYGRTGEDPGKVCLVLAAGNASAIGPMDALYKLFVENQVVVYKSHPVNSCLGPLVERGFRALVDRGFLQVVHGGAAEGAYLCRHPAVDTIHMTGSDKTFDAIIFGSGAEGARRKAEHRPQLTKPVTAELGCVSPVIVIPGPWSAADLDYHARNIATTLATNSGFFCATPRVIIQHADWSQRRALLDALGTVFSAVPMRKAYYPGAHDRFAAFLAIHPEAERYGGAAAGERLPWTLIRGLRPDAPAEVCYSTEAFCSLFAETGIEARTIPEYIDKAVDFANRQLWGTLSATIIVHPASLRDPQVARAVARAVANLRYGTVALNHWALLNFSLVVGPWGAYPGNDIYDIGSGIGVVHNTLMFSRPQKTVLNGPFRAFPKPPWFVTSRTFTQVARELTYLEADPSPARLPAIALAALRG